MGGEKYISATFHYSKVQKNTKVVNVQIICLCSKSVKETLLCVRGIPKKSFNRSLLLLILKTSHRTCSSRQSALENLASFTEKHLCWSLFLISLQACGPEAFLKRDFSASIFPVKFAKILRAPTVKTICKLLLLYLQVILLTMHEKES